MPLQSRFLSQLDMLSDKLLKLFENRGGQIGNCLRSILARMTEDDDVDRGQECILKGLCVYLSEDPVYLLREFVAEDKFHTQETIKEDYSWNLGLILDCLGRPAGTAGFGQCCVSCCHVVWLDVCSEPQLP